MIVDLLISGKYPLSLKKKFKNKKFREWYNEKSKEFGSANYQKYKENRNAFLKDSEEYAEYERRLELENESFKQGFADKLKLSLGNYQTKIQRAGNPQWTPIPKAITIER